MTKSMNNLETNKVELEQKIYACWLDTIYWLASGSKYKLLEAAGSAKVSMICQRRKWRLLQE